MIAAVLGGQQIAPEVVRRVAGRVVEAARARGGTPLVETVHETLYAEHQRLGHAATGPAAHRDLAFVAELRHALPHAGDAALERLVRRIVSRYAAEISGSFDPRVYALATRALPGSLARLLGGGRVEERLLLEGEIDALRAAAAHGTVLLMPTHVSNLDSLVIGWALFRLGLPPFAYAAGLNLFHNRALGFFMHNLGAYTVDRAKRDPLYVATLKEYTTVLLEHGQHGLWFPGGTRSRSGEVERRLKLGLLGTAPVALRHGLEAGRERVGLYVVPCTLTYPLVLEASSLVADFLHREGGPRYFELDDEFSRPRRWAAFFAGLHELDLQVHVRFGAPLDVVGNPVGDDGRSRDRRGRPIDVRGYFTVRGRLTEDPARDAEYTRAVAEQLTQAWQRDTVALPTSVLAWAVFDLARAERPRADLFRLLRSLTPGRAWAERDVRARVASLVERLGGLVARGELRAAPGLLTAPPAELIDAAAKTFGTYHRTPVLERRGAGIAVLDPELLYYYRNRLPPSAEEPA